MSRDRAAAGAIADRGLSATRELALRIVDADHSGWPGALARDLVEAIDHLYPRPPTLTVLRLLREGVSELHGLGIEMDEGWHRDAAFAHQTLDIAVSTAGGVADLLDDDQDWGVDLDDRELDAFDGALLAVDGAIPLTRDLLDAAGDLPPSTCRMDLERTLDVTLALRALLRSPGPWRGTLVRQGFEEATEALARVRSTLDVIPGAHEKAALAAHLHEVFEFAVSDPCHPVPGPA